LLGETTRMDDLRLDHLSFSGPSGTLEINLGSAINI